jgi:tetratricopeptide (TPR) repeat protein
MLSPGETVYEPREDAVCGSVFVAFQISEYVEKFDRLYAGYVQFKLERNTKPANKLQEIECLNKYLWKNGTGRAVEGANRFDQVLNNQLDYFENKSQKPGVGNCVGLTDLFNIMAIRAGIDVSTIILSQHRLRTYLESIGMVLERVAGHQYSLHSGIVFENTGGAGLSIRLSKDEVVSAYAGIASEFSNAGIMHFTQKEHEKAIAAFRTAIKLYPKNPDFYANLGNTYYFKRDYHQTLEAYNLASQLNPHNADYRICIGQCYLKLEKYDEAIEAFKIALELNPQDADAHYSLGNAYRDKKEYNQAIAAYEMAIKLKPKESRFYTTLAKVHLKKLISSNK